MDFDVGGAHFKTIYCVICQPPWSEQHKWNDFYRNYSLVAAIKNVNGEVMAFFLRLWPSIKIFDGTTNLPATTSTRRAHTLSSPIHRQRTQMAVIEFDAKKFIGLCVIARRSHRPIDLC